MTNERSTARSPYCRSVAPTLSAVDPASLPDRHFGADWALAEGESALVGALAAIREVSREAHQEHRN